MNDRKKIMFYDSPDRQARLRVRCQYDGLSQSEFFRIMVTGYLEKDERVLSFLKEHKARNQIQGKNKLQKIDSKDKKAKDNIKKFNLDEKDIQSIYDIIESECDI